MGDLGQSPRKHSTLLSTETPALPPEVHSSVTDSCAHSSACGRGKKESEKTHKLVGFCSHSLISVGNASHPTPGPPMLSEKRKIERSEVFNPTSTRNWGSSAHLGFSSNTETEHICCYSSYFVSRMLHHEKLLNIIVVGLCLELL